VIDARVPVEDVGRCPVVAGQDHDIDPVRVQSCDRLLPRLAGFVADDHDPSAAPSRPTTTGEPTRRSSALESRLERLTERPASLPEEVGMADQHRSTVDGSLDAGRVGVEVTDRSVTRRSCAAVRASRPARIAVVAIAAPVATTSVERIRDRCRRRVGRALLEGRGGRQEVVGRVGFEHGHFAGRQRSGLVEDDDVDRAQALEDRLVEDDDPALERRLEARRDGVRCREAERPRARDHEGHQGGQRDR